MIGAMREETTAKLALGDEEATDRFDRATAIRATSRMMKTELEKVHDSMKTFVAQTKVSMNESVASTGGQFETALNSPPAAVPSSSPISCRSSQPSWERQFGRFWKPNSKCRGPKRPDPPVRGSQPPLAHDATAHFQL
jgi:hypothetical protein